MVELEFHELTEDSFSLYSIIGRLLTLCAQFEADLRVLAAILEVRQMDKDVLKDPNALNRIVAKVARGPMHQRVLGIIRQFKDFSGFEEVEHTLLAAKAARNELAHDLTLGLLSPPAHEQLYSSVLSRSVELLEVITHGHALVLLITAGMTHEDPSQIEHLISFHERARSWVLDVTP